MKSIEAQADAIASRVRAKPCVVARHPQAALIDALIRRGLASYAIQNEPEIPNGPSDSALDWHRKGKCTCRRT